MPKKDIYFVDIGANIGSLSIIIAANGFSVIAIEAMEDNVLIMKASMCLNPKDSTRIQLIHTALGKEEDECVFYSGDNNVGDGHVACGDNIEIPQRYHVRQTMHVRRLDDIMHSFGNIQGRVGAMKIDVEGAEPWVVQGGAEFIDSVKPMSIATEVSSMSIGVSKTSTYEYMKFLTRWYTIRDGGFLGPSIAIEDLAPGGAAERSGEIENMYLTLK